ncbi:MAG: aminotransferase class IV [Pseudomonadota bacterium]|nr:aminotransferase class IV [Pseudomonadota bacterium]
MPTWCNGGFVEQLTLAVNERGLMLGDGIFETIAVHHGKAIWLDEHLSRLREAANELGIPFAATDVHSAVVAILQKSSAASEVLRITLTRGPTARGLAAQATNPSLILTLNSFDKSKLPATVRLQTSAIRRNPTSPTARMKTLNYLDNIMAARGVSAAADDALLLDTRGHVSCSTVANIFVLSENRLLTPELSHAILPGITRAKILQGASQMGLSAGEGEIAPHDLLKADTVFVCNSLRLATPVSTIDGKVCRSRDIGFINDYLNRSSS